MRYLSLILLMSGAYCFLEAEFFLGARQRNPRILYQGLHVITYDPPHTKHPRSYKMGFELEKKFTNFDQNEAFRFLFYAEILPSGGKKMQ